MAHQVIGPDEWMSYDRRAFAEWFNTLEGMRSPVVIATQDGDGQPNGAIFNSLTHVGARPPHLGFVMRPLTVERHTYENLKASGYYTINHLPSGLMDAAHRTSGKYDQGVNELQAVGLTALPSGQAAPYVAEATVSMLLEFVEEHFIAANDTVFIVGAVREIRVPEGAAFGSSAIWDQLQGTVVSGLYEYYDVTFAKRRGYVKV